MSTLTTTTQLNPYSVINESKLSDSSKKQYCRAIELYLNAGYQLNDAGQLKEYAKGLKTSPKAFLKSAIRLWTLAIEKDVKSNANPDNVLAVQATIYRLQSLNDSITIEQTKGKKSHNWLSGSQVKHLREVINNERDYLIICVMLQCGLRRNEVITLKHSDIGMLGDKHILSVVGKGDKLREIPITERLATQLREFNSDSETIFNVSSQTVMNICRKYGKKIGLAELAPHDLRRTFAQTALDNNVPLPQISKLLGHSSVETTMRYLDLDTQNLPTIGDYMSF